MFRVYPAVAFISLTILKYEHFSKDNNNTNGISIGNSSDNYERFKESFEHFEQESVRLERTTKEFCDTINALDNIEAASKLLNEENNKIEKEENRDNRKDKGKDKGDDNFPKGEDEGNNNFPKVNNNLSGVKNSNSLGTYAMTASSTIEKMEIPGLWKICVHAQPSPLLATGYSLANWPAPTSKEDLELTKHFERLTTEEKLERVVGLLAKKANIKKTATQFGVWVLLYNRLNHYCLTNSFQVVTLKDGTTTLADLLKAVRHNPSQLNSAKSLFDHFGSLTAGQIAALNKLYNKYFTYQTITQGEYTYSCENKWSALVVKSFLSKDLDKEVQKQYDTFSNDEKGGPLLFFLAMVRIHTGEEDTVWSLYSGFGLLSVACNYDNDVDALIKILDQVSK